MSIKYSKCKNPNICKGCGSQYPNYVTIDGIRRNLSGRRYCLECAPYNGKRNNRRPYTRKSKTIDGIEHKWCPYKSHWTPRTNFGRIQRRHSHTECQSYCKACQKDRSQQLRTAIKKKAVQYGGSQCQDCNGTFPDCAYDFHHLDPTQKDFKISAAKTIHMSWRLIVLELDKCILLCANCHRIRHSLPNPIEKISAPN